MNPQNAITEADERFQNLIKETPVGIIVLLGKDFIVDAVNKMYGDLINKTPEELKGKPLFTVIPETEEHFRSIIEGVRTSGDPVYLYDHPYFVFVNDLKKEGFLNLVYQPYREKNGTIIGVIILCHDVTNQVNDRKKIEESELFARSIIQNSEVAHAVWLGEDLLFSMVNQKMIEMIGQDFSILGKPAKDVFSTQASNIVVPRLLKVLHTGIPFYQSEETFSLERNGLITKGFYDYTYKALSDAKGEIYGVICTAINVTDQVVSRQKIKQAEERAILAINSAELGTYEIDLVTDEMKTSERFNKIWGVNHSITRPEFANYIHPDFRDLRVKAHEDSLTTGNLQYEARLINENKSILWVKVSGKVLFDIHGKPNLLLGVIQDITEQKLFAEELKKQVAERTADLNRSNEDLLQFAHVTSHDLKEPVRKITTFNNRLKDEFGDLLPEKAHIYLNKMQHSADRMFAMIEGVLTYSTLNSSNEPIEKIDLNSIIKHIETDLEIFIQQKNAKIELGNLPVIEGASVLIHQLFYNLINNSLKFSKQNTETIIHISGQFVKQEQLEYAKIIVSDNGIGFEKEFAEKIFNAFARLHPKDIYEGTGLGLALCKRIVERHHGSISADSAKDRGAQFTILLPLIQSQNKI